MCCSNPSSVEVLKAVRPLGKILGQFGRIHLSLRLGKGPTVRIHTSLGNAPGLSDKKQQGLKARSIIQYTV